MTAVLFSRQLGCTSGQMYSVTAVFFHAAGFHLWSDVLSDSCFVFQTAGLHLWSDVLSDSCFVFQAAGFTSGQLYSVTGSTVPVITILQGIRCLSSDAQIGYCSLREKFGVRTHARKDIRYRYAVVSNQGIVLHPITRPPHIVGR